MLKNISKIISPELLVNLYKMGHGDEIVISDAHFPAYTFNDNVIRSDAASASAILDAILPLFEVDNYVKDNIVMMKAVKGDSLDKRLIRKYQSILDKYITEAKITHIDRYDFYHRTKEAFCVCITGTTEKYGNIILKKGVVST